MTWDVMEGPVGVYEGSTGGLRMVADRLWELATDGRFREAAGFPSPPRAGVVTAIEASGQVRVAMDDPDGGDVLAWPLNGFTYAVDDVVYVAFAANSPDGGVVIGSKAPSPLGPTFAAATTKATPVDADELPLADSAAGNVLKALSWANLKATLKTYFDTLYATVGGWVKADGTVSLTGDWNIGSGRKLGIGVVPTTELDITGTNPKVRVGRTGNAGVVGHEFHHAGNIKNAIVSVATGAWGKGNLYVVQDNVNDTNGYDYTVDSVMGIVNGWIGIGANPATSPQGKLHAHDGTGGMLFVTKTGVSTTAVTLIANGTGDVTQALSAQVVVSDGTTGVGGTITLAPGGYSDVVAGTLTARFSCAADGSVTVKRQAGTGTAKVSLLGVWL